MQLTLLGENYWDLLKGQTVLSLLLISGDAEILSTYLHLLKILHQLLNSKFVLFIQILRVLMSRLLLQC
jgi:hypothetical protein